MEAAKIVEEVGSLKAFKESLRREGGATSTKLFTLLLTRIKYMIYPLNYFLSFIGLSLTLYSQLPHDNYCCYLGSVLLYDALVDSSKKLDG